MTRRVYLHIGAPKTGTTYLQDRLALNRSELAKHDVHYPLGLQASHFKAAIDLLDVSWGGQREDARGEWGKLMDRVRRHSGTVIVSHEILAGARPAQIRKAMADLAGSEVHLVYSARYLARQIPAEWQEGIKHRRRRSFARFLTQVQNARRNKPTMWFWRAQGLPDVLTRWGDGLSPDRIHLVTVPHAGAPRDLLWERYCSAFGIDPSWAPAESDRENVSIGTAETALIRKLNRRLKKAGLEGPDYRRLVRQVMVHETLAQRPRRSSRPGRRARRPPRRGGAAGPGCATARPGRGAPGGGRRRRPPRGSRSPGPSPPTRGRSRRPSRRPSAAASRGSCAAASRASRAP